VVDAELREGPAVAAAQELDHVFVLAARQRQAFAVGEILRPHRQRQVHVVLQGAHQIGVAAGGEQRDVEGVVGLMDAAQVLRIGLGAIMPLQLGELLDQV
jgi:hypothetical protein